ncbi:hypothetical protein HPB48_022183 [Haemaphysalis longicornis]|uniref:Uncharacterized protein n=1 Tax=Haemaphysalis longicornis TaxID=44386 RepID=A0A9J6FT68_HAELO|nr:hypothetical protein HPB48_022183 [Haemaphysalis longicornis]
MFSFFFFFSFCSQREVPGTPDSQTAVQGMPEQRSAALRFTRGSTENGAWVQEAVSERGWDPLNELQETTDLAGWPFTDPMQQPLIWRAAARLLRRFNLPALLSVGVEKHPHSPDTNIISVGLPELLLPYNLGNRSLKWYYSAVMHAVSPFREGAVAPVLAVEVSSFESHLSNIVAPRPRFAIQKLAAAHPELAEASPAR